MFRPHKLEFFEILNDLAPIYEVSEADGYILNEPEKTFKGTFWQYMSNRDITCTGCHKRIKYKDNTTQSKCLRHIGTFRDNSWSCCKSMQRRSTGCSQMAPHIFHLNGAEELHNAIPFVDISYLDTYIRDHPFIGLDVEMVSTSLGSEVAKVTVVDFVSYELLYDKFVRPQGVLYDTHSSINNIKESDIIDNSDAVSFEQCIKELTNKYIGSNSVVVGHSLGNDLKALRLCGVTVLDTAVIFPKEGSGTSAGGSYKKQHSLKDLVKQELGFEIQQGAHNSVEDVISAIKLVESILKEYAIGWNTACDLEKDYDNYIKF